MGGETREEEVRSAFLMQAEACEKLGSPFTAKVCRLLAERLDPVFLPRPLLKVDRLPRNETGKVTRDALRALGSAATVRRGRS